MRVKLISCWFATSYGAYTDGLRRALERRLDGDVGVIASNCGCGDPIERRREFQDDRCEYFELPNVRYFKSSNKFKYRLRNALRDLAYRERARRYLARGKQADVLHFQQILNATGSMTAFNWLRLPAKAARVITIHELDPYQLDVPGSNLAYNKADRIIVHADELRDKLIQLGVRPDLIDVIGHGVELRPLPDAPRSGIVFYAGHRPASGKGMGTLFAALARVKAHLGEATPELRIHGHYGEAPPDYGVQLAREYAIESHIRWLNQIPLEKVIAEYQRARLCVLPYTGSFAGFPAVNAMAAGVPVIATRRAGLPEHLGAAAAWMAEDDDQGLAQQILALLQNESEHERLARAGRERAERLFTWDAIAEKTVASYREALAHQSG